MSPEKKTGKKSQFLVVPTTCDHIEFCSGEIRWTFYIKHDADSDLCRTDYVLLRELEKFR